MWPRKLLIQSVGHDRYRLPRHLLNVSLVKTLLLSTGTLQHNGSARLMHNPPAGNLPVHCDNHVILVALRECRAGRNNRLDQVAHRTDRTNRSQIGTHIAALRSHAVTRSASDLCAKKYFSAALDIPTRSERLVVF